MTTPVEPDEHDSGSTLVSGIQRASTIVAPITVVTALLVYVGWIRNNAYFSYFGVTQSMLSLSLQDYVVRSVDVTFGAVARLVAVVLAYLVVDRALVFLRHRLRERSTTVLTVVLTVLGLILVSAGMASAVRLSNGLPPLLAAVMLGLGAVLLLRFGPMLAGRRPGEISYRSEALAIYAALSLALFWAATVYAQQLGQRAAEAVGDYPAQLPSITILSDKDIGLSGPSIGVTSTNGPRGGATYRYSGFFLLAYSNNRWFLATGRSIDGHRSPVVVLQDSSDIRVTVTNRVTT